MANHHPHLYVGASRNTACRRTLEVITNKLQRLGAFSGGRLLDVGCGDGSFTIILGTKFREIHAIDVQESYLMQFRQTVQNDARFSVSNMSASDMSFADNYFDTVVTIETLEHVPDLISAASEISRVLKPGGELLITVPNRWFPFENHGMRIGSRDFGSRIPLLPYVPWLHSRLALARVFTARRLDSLFLSNGLKRTGLDYAWPTFEHGGNRFQRYLRPLFGLMRRLENSPFRVFGSSVIVKYTKPEQAGADKPIPTQNSDAS